MKLLFYLVFFLFSQVLVESVDFPQKEWRRCNPEEIQKLASDKLDDLFNYAFDSTAKYQTDSLILYYKDCEVKARYANGYGAGQLHRVWSISKSISAILVGIAEQKGLLSREDLVAKYYPEIEQRYADQLKIRHLLQMSSGLDWKEGYETNPLGSNVIQMLYVSGYADMANYTASMKFSFVPGTRWLYSSGESNLMMGCFKKSMSQQQHAEFPWKELFDPIGIQKATWERDASGTFVGSSYLYLAPSDLAKIGYLYLRGGKWGQQQIISQAWINFTLGLAPALVNPLSAKSKSGATYGGQWWLNRPHPQNGSLKGIKGIPENAYFASGHHGQFLAVFPDEQLIMVRSATDKKDRIDRSKLFTLAYEVSGKEIN